MKIRIGRYYIAYGSNLNLEQMKHRCPTAQLKGKAVLKDYRLRFYGSPDNSVATVEPHEGSKVPVLVWLVFTDDEERLDIYEGYPRLYRKETVKVNFCGEKTDAMIYIMNTELYPLGFPSKNYYRTILDGYRDAGFDTNILREAVLSIWEDDDLSNSEEYDDEYVDDDTADDAHEDDADDDGGYLDDETQYDDADDEYEDDEADDDEGRDDYGYGYGDREDEFYD